MTKVKDIVYKRYTIEEGKAAFTAFETAMKSAKSAEDILRAREAWLAEMRHYSTAASLSNCRFTLNTRDEFYQSEVEYYDEKNPEFSELLTAYASLMLDTPFRPELEKKLNPRIFKSFEVQRKAFSPLVTEECKKENALTTEYSKFMSEMKFEYDGKELPLSVLRGYLSHADRNVRRAAAVVTARTDCTACLFLGDGTRHIEYLRGLAPHMAFVAVRGNCDTFLDGDYPGETIFAVEGHNLFLCHGHRFGVKSGTGALLAAARRAGADIALFGHTHLVHEEYDPESGIYLFNPGSIGEPREGKPSYGILSLAGENVLFSTGNTE